MQYLVTTEASTDLGLLPPQQMAQMLEQVITPSIEAIVKLEKEKKILAGGIPVGSRSGVLIVEAASNDELDRLLLSLPLWGLYNFNVTPLESFQSRLAQQGPMLERLKAASQ